MVMEEAVEYEAVALHDFAEYIQGCVTVLDEEWARSASSRCVLKRIKEIISMKYGKNKKTSLEDCIGTTGTNWMSATPCPRLLIF